MVLYPPSLKRDLLRTAETLAIVTAGGGLFTVIGLPAGLISGSLLSVGIAALFGRPVLIPRPLALAISVLVGISLGAVVTPDTLKGLGAFPISIALLIVSTTCMVAATTSYLHFVHGWDPQSAFLGSSPGALGQVMILAADYGVDLRPIAIVQVMRVVTLTLGIPAALSFFGFATQGTLLPPSGPLTSIGEVAILVVVSSLAAVAVHRLRFPGGLMFGAMMGSGALHGSGYIHVSLPWWVATAAVIGIGALTGSRFANTNPRMLLRYLGAALGSFAVAISVASFFVFVLTRLLPVKITDVVVAFSPGAQDTMMVLALALHLDPIFVGAHQVARFLLVSISLPLLANKLRRGPPQALD